VESWKIDWESCNRAQGGVVVQIENSPLARQIKEDLIANREIVKKLEEYWRNLGHEVKYEIVFIEKLNVHTIKTDDLKNGVPCKEKLTSIARKTLLRLPR
jgi:hypothetical protein